MDLFRCFYVLLSTTYSFRKSARVWRGEATAALVYRDSGVATDDTLIIVFKFSFKGTFTDLSPTHLMESPRKSS